MMKKSIFSKLLLSYIAVVAFSFLVSGILSSQFFSRHYLASKEEEIMEQAKTISEFISRSPQEEIPETLPSLRKGVKILLIRRQELSSPNFPISEPPPPPWGRIRREPLPHEMIEKVLQGETVVFRGFSPRFDQTMLIAASPVVRNGEVSSILLLLSPIVNIEATLSAVRRIILISSTISLIFSLLLSYFFSHSLTHPIRKISEAARDLASGNLQRRIEVSTEDELGQLAQDFNYLSSALEKTINNLHQEKRETENILLHMAEGVVATDEEGKITSINPALLKKLEWEGGSPLGLPISQLFPQTQIQEMFSQALKEGKEEAQEFQTENGDHLILHLTPLKEGEKIYGAVGVFQDITELRQLEELRRDFLANVSHELRTPLTSIQGFVEAMMDGVISDEELRKKYLEVIHRETLRLSRLIHDLLDLSLMESKKIEWEMGPLSLPPLIDQVLLKLMPQIEDKKIQVKKDFTPQLPLVWGNMDRIEQVFINLLSNALIFSPPESTIEIKVWKEQKEVVISIKDQGEGIPEKDIPHLFERFYRVEKSRSREKGGTGLGLAIAKQIIENHGGKIKVESQPYQGSTFIFTLPLASEADKDSP
ncbi:MAG: HAMP domain-containing protein [Candidatus Atribacteria bacterium]|nr:HAMP domain-containing protein [Candidatus Atribacteria bacterium]